MKFVLLLLVLVVVGLVFFGRRRAVPPPDKPTARKPDGPQAMLACAHCGVHLPQAEALMDAAGRPYCSEAHRLHGPR